MVAGTSQGGEKGHLVRGRKEAWPPVPSFLPDGVITINMLCLAPRPSSCSSEERGKGKERVCSGLAKKKKIVFVQVKSGGQRVHELQ